MLARHHLLRSFFTTFAVLDAINAQQDGRAVLGITTYSDSTDCTGDGNSMGGVLGLGCATVTAPGAIDIAGVSSFLLTVPDGCTVFAYEDALCTATGATPFPPGSYCVSDTENSAFWYAKAGYAVCS